MGRQREADTDRQRQREAKAKHRGQKRAGGEREREIDYRQRQENFVERQTETKVKQREKNAKYKYWRRRGWRVNQTQAQFERDRQIDRQSAVIKSLTKKKKRKKKRREKESQDEEEKRKKKKFDKKNEKEERKRQKKKKRNKKKKKREKKSLAPERELSVSEGRGLGAGFDASGRLRRSFSVTRSVNTIFNKHTTRSLARCLSERKPGASSVKGGTPPPGPLRQAASFLLLFFVFAFFVFLPVSRFGPAVRR